MRLAWMDEVVSNIESMIYVQLKPTNLAKDVIQKSPNQSVQELASMMAKVVHKGKGGDLARQLGSQYAETAHYDLLCKEAFENAMTRLLTEARQTMKGGKQDEL